MKKYELDTVGQIYGAIATKTWSPMFRMQATLYEVVSPELLQQAAEDPRIRFPYIFVALKQGTCSYYFEENDEPLKIRPDREPMQAYYGMEEASHHCVRIFYGEKHIALEVLHALTDGHGACVILLTLVHRHLELKHGLPEIPANFQHDLVYSLNDKPFDEETGNAFAKNVGKNPVNLKEPKAYKLHGTRLPNGQKQKKEPIAIGIPVNVREILASKTMRNYSVQKSITLLPEQSNLSLQQKCNLMGKQLKDFLQDKDLVRNMTAAYVASLENPLVIFQRKCAPS